MTLRLRLLRRSWLRRGLGAAAALGALAVAIAVALPLPAAQGAGNHYNEVEQTRHNILPPNSLYTMKDLCYACHVDGKIQLPGMPAPPEEEAAALPTFVSEREQRPEWEPDTPVKNFTLSANWPLPAVLRADQPFGVSADCLGCHDGTFAEDVHHGNARTEVLSCAPLCAFFDRIEDAAGTSPGRKSSIPDHPISTFYPRRPDGDLLPKEPVSNQRRFFAIADLQDDQLIMPTGQVSRFYSQTPGSPAAVRNGNGVPVAPTAASAEADPTEPFRLIRTTFGVIHCDSCHNAHSELHAGFLRDKSPQLCLICHDR